jgi:hypothetical protein
MLLSFDAGLGGDNFRTFVPMQTAWPEVVFQFRHFLAINGNSANLFVVPLPIQGATPQTLFCSFHHRFLSAVMFCFPMTAMGAAIAAISAGSQFWQSLFSVSRGRFLPFLIRVHASPLVLMLKLAHGRRHRY